MKYIEGIENMRVSHVMRQTKESIRMQYVCTPLLVMQRYLFIFA